MADNKANSRTVSLVGLALVTCIVLGTAAQAAEPVAPKLTPKLQELLRKEMISINAASQEILAAMVAGDGTRVAKLAQQIHDSFILRQSMTLDDKKDLMAAVPAGFVQQDKAFHKIAATLAEAGQRGDQARQHEIFGRMLAACSACHAAYATDRFPNFGK